MTPGYILCDRCAEKIFEPFWENAVEEGDFTYCLECYNKLLEQGEI